MELFMDVTGNLWICSWMLLEMYANLWICCMDVTGFFWKLMFFFFMYVTGNLWIDFLMDVTGNLCFFSWRLLGIYVFFY